MGLLQLAQGASGVCGEGEAGEWGREAVDLEAELRQLAAQAARQTATHAQVSTTGAIARHDADTGFRECGTGAREGAVTALLVEVAWAS
jgi:hypothetical protein